MTQQPPKKSGSRDISALKERLRPKTGAPASGSRPVPAPGGTVLPPPGLDIPPPPGVATASAPAAAPVPDAHHDPFGHMNAMAQMGAAQRAPEIVIVHDGKPVETVATHHRIANIAKIAGIALVPLVVGIAIRGISKDAHAYNSGVIGAKIVNNEVVDLKKQLGKLQDRLYGTEGIEAKEAAKKNISGREVTAALTDFSKVELDENRVFQAKHYNLGARLSGQVLEFYAGVAELKQMVADHVRLAKNDDAALAKALEESKKLTLSKEQQAGIALRYAVMMWNPTPEEARADPTPPGMRLVEVGVLCGDEKAPPAAGCPADKPPQLAVRWSTTSAWVKADFLPLGTGEATPIANRKVLPFAPNDLLANLALTPEGTAAEVAYQKRLQHIKEKLAEVIKLANDLEKPLGDKARAGKHFTFFM